MAEFWVEETGERFTGSQEEAAAAYLDKKLIIDKESAVQVVSPVNGEILDIDPSELNGALKSGFVLPSQQAEQQHHLVKAQEGIGGALGMAAMEATNTLTFGATDAAAAAAFGEGYEDWRRAQQTAYPTASGAIRLVTEAATAVGSGGASLVGRGAAKAAGHGLARRALARTPAAIVSRAAVTGEKALANQLARNTMRRGAVSAGAAAAVEGAMFEAGRVVSDLSVDGVEQSGTEILAAIGDAAANGAIGGGIAGGVIGGFAGGLQARAAKRAGLKTEQNLIEEAGGEAASPGKFGGFRDRMRQRGDDIIEADHSLSETARTSVRDGRSTQEAYDSGADWSRTGDTKRGKIKSDLEGNLNEASKLEDQFNESHVHVADRRQTYREAMVETPGAPVEDMRKATTEVIGDNVDLLRSRGVNVEYRQPKAVRAADSAVKQAEKQAARHAKLISSVDDKIARAETKLSQVRERAVTTTRKAKTGGLEADLRKLRQDRAVAVRDHGKATSAFAKAEKKAAGAKAKGKPKLEVVGFNNALVPKDARPAMAELVSIHDAFLPMFAKAGKSEDVMQLADMFNRRVGKMMQGVSDETAFRVLKATHDDMSARFLTNGAMVGRKAAGIQESMQGAWVRKIDADKAGGTTLADHAKGERQARGVGLTKGASSTKISTFVDQSGRQVNNGAELAALRDIDARIHNIKTQGEYSPSATPADIERAVAPLQAARDNIIDAVRGKADAMRFQQSLQFFKVARGAGNAVQADLNAGSAIPAPAAFGIAGVTGSPLLGSILFGGGFLVKNTAGIATRFADTAVGQSLLGLTRTKGRDAIEAGVDGVKNAIRKGRIGRSSGTVLKRSMRAIPVAARGVTRNREEDRYAYAIRTVQAYQTDPQTALSNLVNRLGTMPTDTPAAAASLVATAERGMKFLNTKLPPVPPPDSFGKDDEIRRIESIPVSQKLKYMRYHDAVNDPVGFLRGLPDGQITSEAVEAMREVYPGIHREVVTAITEVSSERKLSRFEQSYLSTVIGSPMGRNFEGGFISNIQATVEMASEQASSRSKQTVSPSRAQAPKQGFSEMGATRAQQIAGNARE